MTDTAHPAVVDPAALRAWLASGAGPRVLDVRGPAEFAAVHIPGSYNVPLDVLREHRDEVAGHLDTDVVLVCRSGARATQAERALAEAGLGNVHVLAGGMVAWEKDGAAVNRGRARWDIERQVRFTAGSLVLAGVLGGVVVPALRWLAAAVGGGLAVAALTNTCALGAVLSRLPFNRGAGCDLDRVVAQLSGQGPGGRR
ncbi:MAG TPA: rhodanese-like domain-containing protein [Mycobacteriales bacterium]|nr:rhodanese-like domain-containing protein [Mycobacteriales bacterium]